MKIQIIPFFIGFLLFGAIFCPAQELDLTGGEIKYGENELHLLKCQISGLLNYYSNHC